MDRAWYWKAGLILAVTVLSIWALVPSYTYFKLPAGDRNDSGVFEKARPKWAPAKHLNLGLDLQGGIHLVMGVEVDRAVREKAVRRAEEIAAEMDRKGVKGADVRGDPDTGIVTVTAPDLDKAKEVLAEYTDMYTRRTSGSTVELAMKDDAVKQLKDGAVDQAVKAIRNRVDKWGVSEPTIAKRGDASILVQLPGYSNPEKAKELIGKTAQLEFKIVDDGSEYMRKVAGAVPKDSGIEIAPESWSEKDSGKQHEDVYLRSKSREALQKFFASQTGELAVPPDHEIGYEEMPARSETGEQTPDKLWRTYYLHKRAALTGEYLTNADQTWDQSTGRPEVAYEFDHQGAAISERLTGDNIGRKMAVILDDRIKTAPVIKSRIGSRGRITLGSYGDPFALQEEAKEIVAVLRSGALPAPLTKSFETQVGPTMGKDSIEKAKLAMGIGAAAVVIFMLLYYRVSGLIAVLAMLLNMLYMMAILAGFEASLTLPGIAGLVLTVGMAVDANIIIYERIREELRLGKSVRTAVDAGFQRAFWTVFDAHVTNFVAGVVLYSYGSGPIRGFAVTLLVGIITNLFTSYWVSHWMFDAVVGRRGAAKPTLSI